MPQGHSRTIGRARDARLYGEVATENIQPLLYQVIMYLHGWYFFTVNKKSFLQFLYFQPPPSHMRTNKIKLSELLYRANLDGEAKYEGSDRT